MVAVAVNQVEGACQGSSSMITSKFETVATQGKVPTCLANENALKVRKPYTITKQREKWTEEEHQRFLEALKLYGRAWRQIEEYVGSKTAIQIRSHAQKFFAKVARDSGQPERSPSPNGSGRDNRSPDSVLSANGVGVSEYPIAEQQNSRFSPVSCTTDAHTATVISAENDDESMNSNSNTIEEIHVELKPVAASTNPITNSHMQCGVVHTENPFNGEKLAVEPPSASIKLFGQTVFVPYANKLDLQAPYNCNSLPSKVTEKEIEISNEDALHGFQANQANSPFMLSMVPSNTISSASWLSQYMLENNAESTAAFPTTISWWSWYQDLVYRSISSCGQTAVGTAADCQVPKDDEPQREGSSTGSSIGSASEVDDGNKSSETIESKCTTKSDKWNSSKGFVPYKRCLTERDGKPSGAVLEERESQRVRVCS